MGLRRSSRDSTATSSYAPRNVRLQLCQTSTMIQARSVDWGNVPQWVSGLLAGVSVILALSILVRDRRDRHMAQARRVLIRSAYKASPNDDSYPIAYRLTLHNTSESSIWAAKFILVPRPRRRRLRDYLRRRHPRTPRKAASSFRSDKQLWAHVLVGAFFLVEEAWMKLTLALEPRSSIPLAQGYFPSTEASDEDGTIGSGVVSRAGWELLNRTHGRYRVYVIFADAAGRHWTWDLYRRKFVRPLRLAELQIDGRPVLPAGSSAVRVSR